MEPIDGYNASTTLPDRYVEDGCARHRMGLEAAAGLAALGEIDYRAIGLDGFGNPEGFLERQVPRWLAELESYSEYRGYPGPELPNVDTVAGWLEANRPNQWRSGLLHGDFHLANLMFSHDRPKLAAIVDWEMSTIGDPLLDLGWLVATWPDGSVVDKLLGRLAEAGGLAHPSELIAHYGDVSGRDVSAIDWYIVLACFKLGIVLEGTHARACAGMAPKRTGDLLHAIAMRLFEKAAQLAV